MELYQVYLSLLLENKQMNISQEIKDLTKEYIRKHDGKQLIGGSIAKCSLANDINNGYCVEFSEDLLRRLGGENDHQFILSTDMFCNYDALELWGEEDVIETYNGSGWSKRMLQMYGEPKIDYDLRNIDDLPHHQWACINGRHYDAECPDGASTWYELPFFVSFFVNFKNEFL
jgi:hypothetical protein